jgi:porphobilinogen synthase
MSFPAERPRRLRQSSAWRRLSRETELSAADLILPLFIVSGKGRSEPVESMPGVSQLSVDRLAAEAESAARAGIGGVLLFGVLDDKDAKATAAADPNGLVPQAIRAIKARTPELLVWADVCLCGATDHGHCGLVSEAGTIQNDESLPVLARVAASYAAAGADAVAPSDMMDGRVGAIRRELDARGMSHVPIVSYAAKYASAFYGPFREAADSAPAFGDRRSYQMDPANAREAVREVLLDLEEGADIVMVKPAGPYLDVVRRVRDAVDCPVAAYHVSGEYSMIKAAARAGWLDERAAALEVLTGIRRAGADVIITYFAKDAAAWLADAKR